MRVSHVIAPGPMAGAENVVLQGCAALLAKGHELALLVMVDRRCPEHGERFVDAAHRKGIPTSTIPVRGRLDPRAISSLRTLLKSNDTEVVHVHGYKALIYALLARSRGSGLVVTHHGDTGHDSLARFYERLARFAYRLVDLVFSVSRATTEALADAGVPRSKLRTVPNPVSLPAPDATAARGASEGALLFVGRLSEEKGLDVLLRAMASPEIPEDLMLEVAGDGPSAKAWKALASSLGLDERVRWLGVRRDVPALLAGARALVLPSLREGLPLVVLEAASCEVPVVASRVGGVPETVWEGETAILVEPGDVAAWTSALQILLSRAEHLREGAQRRGAEVRARHAPERWAELTSECYREAAK
ncbi:MAG: glycosyltransferase [Deltaproteobacteria bacterium]|nr:glycosyltransferase [Deltaproteobacteria bacterium]